MRKFLALAPGVLMAIAIATPAAAGVPTPHRLSFQGLARNSSNQPVVSGDVRVRIYDAPTGGALVYDSGSEFVGAIATGVFNVLLGGGTPLLLDNTLQYHLELDINAEEIIGDAAAGRQAFWPAGGDQARPDLEARIETLEALVFAECDPGEFDLNGNPADGCEFVLDPNGIYVDAADPGAIDDAGCGQGPVGTCPDCEPCRTITHGLVRAVATGRTTVYVANGTYPEAVTLVDGKNLLGGYRGGTWERNLGATATVLRGESVAGNHKRAVVGSGVTSPTIVEGFVVFGPVATAAGGNSYAIYLSNSGGLTLRSNVIFGGVGGPGADGPPGALGEDGVPGSPGGDAIQSPDLTCPTSLNRAGGAGGARTCGATNVSGGAGGGNRCTPVPGSEFSGIDGTNAPGVGGGTGGDAGDDAERQGTLCNQPANPTLGANGGNGAAGTVGSGGMGATNAAGSVTGGQWIASAGSTGGTGGPGRGGGGGGAGGGSNGISPERDVLGGAGGGGGSGACGGGAGGGGNGGGGSFGIFVMGGTAPAITSNVIYRGWGGTGGRGGLGGKAGIGGLGGAGGLVTFFCCNAGGRGGDGGSGGHGGGGGGGAGGISSGIFTSGIGAPNYGATNTVTGGAAGAGGSGGSSFGNAGTAGVSGSLTTVTSQ